MTVSRPSVEVAVVMRKERITGAMSRWQTWRWLYPGFRVELFRDDAEGYYLNVSTPAPCWFVLWRCKSSGGLRRRGFGEWLTQDGSWRFA
jgi:hypothetical protein